MTILSPRYQPIIHRSRYCNNGLYPDVAFYSRVQGGLNFLTAYRRKPVFQRTVPLGAAGGTTGTAWRWYCRTGYGAKRFAVMAVLGLDDRNLAADPYIDVTITAVGGAALTTLSFHYGASSVIATDAPDEFQASTQFVACAANTVYSGAVAFTDNVRVISLLVFEDFSSTVDDTTDYFSTYQPAAQSPIYDNRIGQQLQAVGGLIRRNGGLRADWVPPAGAARTRASATYVNLIDDATTGTPTASAYGVTLSTQYRNTASATTVPVTLAVYGSIATGSGTVRVIDTAGSVVGTVTINSATPQWFTTTGTLSTSAALLHAFQYAGDGVNAVSVLAASLYEEGS